MQITGAQIFFLRMFQKIIYIFQFILTSYLIRFRFLISRCNSFFRGVLGIDNLGGVVCVPIDVIYPSICVLDIAYVFKNSHSSSYFDFGMYDSYIFMYIVTTLVVLLGCWSMTYRAQPDTLSDDRGDIERRQKGDRGETVRSCFKQQNKLIIIYLEI